MYSRPLRFTGVSATAQDMQEGAKVFAAMDPSGTPGTRVSADECELKLELKV